MGGRAANHKLRRHRKDRPISLDPTFEKVGFRETRPDPIKVKVAQPYSGSVILASTEEEEENSGQWTLYFKLYCFLDVQSVPKEGVEFAFMFEQAHESLTSGHFPAPEDTLQHLAALRLQYQHGDFAKVSWSLETVYPVQRLKNKILQATKTSSGSSGQTLERRRTSFLEGTLKRSFKVGSMKKQKMEEEQMMEMWVKEELSAARTSIAEKWSRLYGMSQHQAMLNYMAIVIEWPGYGSTLFDVEYKEGGFPNDLWLGVSAENVSVYKRGEPKPLETFQYEHIIFFGAPQPNTFKITVDDREMFFETTQVGEITKIMRAYINMIVKKRCSVKSVTSQDSQFNSWASWCDVICTKYGNNTSGSDQRRKLEDDDKEPEPSEEPLN
ncbi:unnamed protein product [Ranitomeya imitator]|uniref:FERM domain-containing protein n=1 Tax=Ranitomeya imitator TaxID=111125 RepID=A0ABN9LBE2_9NEOB|nr:unnamed protein product [Ranitomeya imitator]